MNQGESADEFARHAQSYYPGQAYNTPSITEFAGLIDGQAQSLVDVGCGDGQLLHLLSERFPHMALAGLTVSEAERAACRGSLDVRVGDMHQLPWPSGSVDVVTSRHSLEHSISPLKALFEINRILRLGGKAYVVVPAPSSDWIMKWPDHFSVLPRLMWEKLFADAGFAVESCSDGTWLASYSMAQEPEFRFVLTKSTDLEQRRSTGGDGDDDYPVAPTIGPAELAPVVDKKIVVVLHNLVLFDGIRPLVERFAADTKIIIPDTEAPGFAEMARQTYQAIAKAGFNVELVRLPADIACEIELSPYPYAIPNIRQAKWRVRFMYGLAKEAWNFSLKNNAYYDFVLTYGKYDSSVLSAYTTPVPVGNMKVVPVRRVREGGRPTVLYLPTYGPPSSIDLMPAVADRLKKKYRLVVKAHHGTSFLEPDRVRLLREIADEYHDHSTPLGELLANTDVVLSDGSGAIFEAIAAGVPVAIFQPQVFAGLRGTESLEEQLIHTSQIPATNDPSKIREIVDAACMGGSSIQDSLRQALFCNFGEEAVAVAAAHLKSLLQGDVTIPPAFVAARKELLDLLQEGPAERSARARAERQLHDAYRLLTDQLVKDVRANTFALAEKQLQLASLQQAVSDRDALLQESLVRGQNELAEQGLAWESRIRQQEADRAAERSALATRVEELQRQMAGLEAETSLQLAQQAEQEREIQAELANARAGLAAIELAWAEKLRGQEVVHAVERAAFLARVEELQHSVLQMEREKSQQLECLAEHEREMVRVSGEREWVVQERLSAAQGQLREVERLWGEQSRQQDANHTAERDALQRRIEDLQQSLLDSEKERFNLLEKRTEQERELLAGLADREREFQVQLACAQKELKETESTWAEMSRRQNTDYASERAGLLSRIERLQQSLVEAEREKVLQLEAHAKEVRELASTLAARERELQAGLEELQRSRRDLEETTSRHLEAMAAREQEAARALEEREVELQSILASLQRDRRDAEQAWEERSIRQQADHAAERIALQERVEEAQRLLLEVEQEKMRLVLAAEEQARDLADSLSRFEGAAYEWEAYAGSLKEKLFAIQSTLVWRLAALFGKRSWTGRGEGNSSPVPVPLPMCDPRRLAVSPSNTDDTEIPSMREEDMTSCASKRPRIDNVDDLLAMCGEVFIQEAYRAVLAREADPGGMEYYLKRLRNGVGKLRILRQMRSSREGGGADSSLAGLDAAIWRDTLSSVPFLGWLRRPEERTDYKLRAIENRLSELDSLAERQRARLETDILERSLNIDQRMHQVTCLESTLADRDRELERLRQALACQAEQCAGAMEGSPVPAPVAAPAEPAELCLPALAHCSHDERDVLVFAVIDWHFRIQRPQHLARSLAKDGRRVFYLSNHFVDADVPGYQIERLDPDLELYQVKLHVKGAPAIYFAPPTEEAEKMIELGIAVLMADRGLVATVGLLQHAYWYPVVTRLPNTLRVYDCMDHHEGFGNVPERLIEIEKSMLKGSDLVIVTSSWLEDFAGKYNRNVALIRNAGEYRHFAEQSGERYVDEKGRRIIGYYGAIAEWFDLELVRKIAESQPDALVLLVGNDTVGAGKALGDLENVVFTGEVSYASLPYYLHAFDVCLLPFQVIPLTLATNPVKVYEYLAAGKSVVCVDLPEISQFEDLVYRASSSDEFVRMVSSCLACTEQESQAQLRRKFASEQTWMHRVQALAQAVDNLSLPRISVVVLTYNNLDLTKRCLDSLVQWSAYPNLEIIVVDNASADGTPHYLLEYQQKHPDLKVLLNGRNLGFAAGNNVGLRAATGDYIVILNNDTVVTPGWVLTMARHLQNDASVGLIGPVTNNIGNEARICIEYQSFEDMLSRARDYTGSRMGQHYPLSTAAFFCVMMRREVYEKVGYLDENFGRGFFEDDDYCRRIEQLGLRVVCAEDVFVHHHLSASFNKLGDGEKRKLFDQNKAYYESKWGKWEPHSYRQ